MVALGLGELAADLLLDLGRKLEHRELPREVLAQPLQPGPDVDLAQQALLLLDRERQARGQQVGQPARLARVDRGDLELLGDLLALVDHPLEEPVDVVHQGVELDPLLDDLLVRLDLGRPGRARSARRSTSRARYCPWQTIRVEPSGNLSILRTSPTQTVGNRSSIPGASVSGCSWLTRRDHPLADHRVVDQPDAARPVDHQRHHRLREDHVGPQRQERDAGRSPSPGPSVRSPSTMICPASTTARPRAPGSSRPASALRARLRILRSLRREFMRGFSEMSRGICLPGSACRRRSLGRSRGPYMISDRGPEGKGDLTRRPEMTWPTRTGARPRSLPLDHTPRPTSRTMHACQRCFRACDGRRYRPETARQ